MPKLLPLRARVGDFFIVELAGQHGSAVLYVAKPLAADTLHWLFTADASLEALAADLPEATAFDDQGRAWVAFPLTAIPLAALVDLMPAFSPRFIGWRWAGLSASVGLMHARAQVYVRDRPLDLRNVQFNAQAQAVLSAPTGDLGHPIPFTAPEPHAALTPASDIYALGASLLVLLGESTAPAALGARPPAQSPLASQPKLWTVLRRAVDAEPARRYADGQALALALNAALPPPQAAALDEKPPRALTLPGSRLFNALDKVLLTLGPFVLFLGLMLGLYVLANGTNIPPFDWLATLFGGLPVIGSNGQPATRSPAAVLLIPTPTALPGGELAIDSYDVFFSAPCTAHLALKLSKGGQPLRADAPVEFGLTVNARAVTNPILVPGGPADAYRFELIFKGEPLCGSGGIIGVGAKIGDSARGLALCNFGPAAVDQEHTEQVTLSLTGAQVDAHAYPDMTFYFSVADPSGAAATLHGTRICGVTQDDQPVANLSLTSVDTLADPPTVVLLFDVSGSMAGEPIANARKAATTFVQQLSFGASACVYAFSTVVSRLQACTDNRQPVVAALGSLNAGGNTSLYDALLQVASDRAGSGGRQVIIVLSDGADTSSRATLAQALAQLKQANLPVYALGLVSKDFNGDALQQIAAETGGNFLQTPAAGDLDRLYLLIQGRLNTQYGLRFASLFPSRKSGSLSLQMENGAAPMQITRPFVANR